VKDEIEGRLAANLDRIGHLVEVYQHTTARRRRHWVVHRVDRSTLAENGAPATQALERIAVEKWFEAVRQLADAVLEGV
jgi:hypothetical protein